MSKYRLTYFKWSGKWYSEWELTTEEIAKRTHILLRIDEINFYDIVSMIKTILMDPQPNPGMSTTQWDGIVMLTEIEETGGDGLKALLPPWNV